MNEEEESTLDRQRNWPSDGREKNPKSMAFRVHKRNPRAWGVRSFKRDPDNGWTFWIKRMHAEFFLAVEIRFGN